MKYAHVSDGTPDRDRGRTSRQLSDSRINKFTMLYISTRKNFAILWLAELFILFEVSYQLVLKYFQVLPRKRLRLTTLAG